MARRDLALTGTTLPSAHRRWPRAVRLTVLVLAAALCWALPLLAVYFLAFH